MILNRFLLISRALAHFHISIEGVLLIGLMRSISLIRMILN